MPEFAQALLIVGIYRVAILAVGLAFGFMGYKLFTRGVYESAGDLKAESKSFRLTFKRGAPGILLLYLECL